MLIDFSNNYEVAALEAAYLSDLSINAELEKTEQAFKTISEKPQVLINQINN